jgi:hypothetical protein
MKTNVDGIEYDIPEPVYKEMQSMFDALEGLRMRLDELLGLDYLSTLDKDIFEAIGKLKNER